MLKSESATARKIIVLFSFLLFVTAIIVLDSSNHFHGSYAYGRTLWIKKTSNDSKDQTENGNVKAVHFLEKGKHSFKKLSEHISKVRSSFDGDELLNTVKRFKYPKSKDKSGKLSTQQAVTLTTELEKVNNIPGVISMDKDLHLPPAIPIRSDNKEPILQYSQKRDYKPLISHDDKCGSGTEVNLNFKEFDYDRDIFMLMIIKSSCSLVSRRNAIRSTWGNETWTKTNLGVNVRRIFLLGKCEHENLQNQVSEEDKSHSDILQWDFFDSFRNLTLKDCLFMQWYTRFCQNVPYVFKGDDDIFANTKNIVKMLKDLPLGERETLFKGSVLVGSPRIVNPSWKYYVSYNLYPERIYPPYVSGGGFVLSGHLAVRLFQASLLTRIIPIDDAFLGILLSKIKVKPTNDKGFKSWGLKNYDICRLAKIKTYHKMLPEKLPIAWKEYLALDLKTCSKDTDDVFRSQMKR